MVEAVAPTGAAEKGGVLEGDILHALTVVMDRSDLLRPKPMFFFVVRIFLDRNSMEFCSLHFFVGSF